MPNNIDGSCSWQLGKPHHAIEKPSVVHLFFLCVPTMTLNCAVWIYLARTSHVYCTRIENEMNIQYSKNHDQLTLCCFFFSSIVIWHNMYAIRIVPLLYYITTNKIAVGRKGDGHFFCCSVTCKTNTRNSHESFGQNQRKMKKPNKITQNKVRKMMDFQNVNVFVAWVA